MNKNPNTGVKPKGVKPAVKASAPAKPNTSPSAGMGMTHQLFTQGKKKKGTY